MYLIHNDHVNLRTLLLNFAKEKGDVTRKIRAEQVAPMGARHDYEVDAAKELLSSGVLIENLSSRAERTCRIHVLGALGYLGVHLQRARLGKRRRESPVVRYPLTTQPTSVQYTCKERRH